MIVTAAEYGSIKALDFNTGTVLHEAVTSDGSTFFQFRNRA